VKDAIREIRSISRGVSLPDIAQRSVCQIITGLAEAHQARSGAPVAVSCDDRGLSALGVAEKTCIYRFVQEGLNNAWRHAEARGQEVRLTVEDDRLMLCVSDDGPGFAGSAPNSEGLGLVGLRDRVEALGGTFEIENRPQGGARLRMTLSPAGES
jgi:signal transduction histidine kinase